MLSSTSILRTILMQKWSFFVVKMTSLLRLEIVIFIVQATITSNTLTKLLQFANIEKNKVNCITTSHEALLYLFTKSIEVLNWA